MNFSSLRDDYLSGIAGTRKHLVKHTAVNKYLFIAELIGANKEIRPKMVNDFSSFQLLRTVVAGLHGFPFSLANLHCRTISRATWEAL